MVEKPKSESWWQTLPGVLTATAAIITALTGLIAVLYQGDFFHGRGGQHSQATGSPSSDTALQQSPCSISGIVFDSNSNSPLSAVWVDLYRDMSSIQQRPVNLKLGLATTGPDGRFTIDCKFVKASEFPVLIGVRHADWIGARITGPKIERAGEWSPINIAIPMSDVELKPLRELSVSFGSKKLGTDWFLVGQVDNKSSRSFPCITARFHMSTSYEDKIQGEPERDLGSISIEIRNLGPNEKRAYQEKLPKQVGITWVDNQECK